jgi:hypothetical protein
VAYTGLRRGQLTKVVCVPSLLPDLAIISQKIFLFFSSSGEQTGITNCGGGVNKTPHHRPETTALLKGGTPTGASGTGTGSASAPPLTTHPHTHTLPPTTYASTNKQQQHTLTTGTGHEDTTTMHNINQVGVITYTELLPTEAQGHVWWCTLASMERWFQMEKRRRQ